jgi:hypothetical protein
VRVGSLHFLDARGYAILVVPEVRCAWREIADLLFPRRRGSVKLGE